MARASSEVRSSPWVLDVDAGDRAGWPGDLLHPLDAHEVARGRVADPVAMHVGGAARAGLDYGVVTARAPRRARGGRGRPASLAVAVVPVPEAAEADNPACAEVVDVGCGGHGWVPFVWERPPPAVAR